MGRVAIFGRDVEQYNTLRSRMLGRATEERLKILNFINGNHSEQRVRELFPNLRILSMLMRPKPSIKIGDVLDYLYTHKEGSDAAKFLWEIQNHSSIIRDTRAILGVLRDFSNQLSQKFNFHFKKSDCDYQTGGPEKKKKGMKTTPTEGMMSMSMMSEDSVAHSAFPAATNSLLKISLETVLDGRTVFQKVSEPKVDKQHKTQQRGGQTSKKDTRYWAKNKTTMSDDDAEESEVEETPNKAKFVSGDLKKFYRERVLPMLQKTLKPLVQSQKDTFRERMAVGCEDAQRLLDIVTNMDDPLNTSLVAFLVPNLTGEKYSADHMVSFKAFIESIISIQSEMIGGYRDLAQFMAPIGKSKKNFFNCHDDEFMSLQGINIEQDLFDNSYYRLMGGTNESVLVVNVQALASKWATLFFSQLEDISVERNFQFAEQRQMSLSDYCNYLQTEKKLRFETNVEVVGYFTPYLKENHEELQNLLLISLEYLHNKDFKGSNDLYGLIPQNIKEYAPDKLLKSIKMSHIRLLADLLEVAGYEKITKQLDRLMLPKDLKPTRLKFKVPEDLQPKDSSEADTFRKRLEHHVYTLKLFFLSVVNNEMIQAHNEEVPPNLDDEDVGFDQETQLKTVLGQLLSTVVKENREVMESRIKVTETFAALKIKPDSTKVCALPKMIQTLEYAVEDFKPDED